MRVRTVHRLAAGLLATSLWLTPAVVQGASSEGRAAYPTPRYSMGAAVGQSAAQSTVLDFVPPNPYAYNLDTSRQALSASAVRPPVPDVREEAAQIYPQPVIGQAKILIIMMDFTDVTFDPAHDAAYWNSMLFDTTPGAKSLSNYYDAVSNHQFRVTGTVAPVVHSDYTMADYGADTPTGGIDRLNGPVYEMAREAVQKLNASGFDFSAYDLTDLADRDRDGITTEPDGYLDHLMILHAGPGQEGNPPVYGTNAIWSHRGYIYPRESVDGVLAANYTTVPEDGRVGVFAHEFGHDIGLPDLYDVSGVTEGLGDWELMAGGSWNFASGEDPGTSPAGLSAWSKNKLGWLNPTPVSSDAHLTIPTDNVAYRIDVAGTSGNEYFLLENRRQTGFDAGLPGSGLLVWHVDDAIRPSDNTDNSTYVAHPRVALVQADGQYDLEYAYNRGDTGDPFPGAAAVTSLNDSTAPSVRGYSGLNSDFSLTNIAIDGSSNVTLDASIAIPTAMTYLRVDNSIFSPNGDTYKESVTASVYMAEPATVTFEVTDLNGSPVASGSDPTLAALHIFTWDGTDLSGNPAPDDRYSLSVTASVYGGGSYTNQIFVTVDTSAPEIYDLHAVSDTVTTGTDDPISMTFGFFNNTEGSGNDWTATGGHYWMEAWQGATLVEDGTLWTLYHSGYYPLFHWWPYDLSGNPYPNGTYTIKVFADDGANITEADLPVIVNIPQPSAPPSGGGGGGGGGTPTDTPVVPGKPETGKILPGGSETSFFGGGVKLLADPDAVDSEVVVTATVIEPDNLPDPAVWLGFKSNVIELNAGGKNFAKPITLTMSYVEDQLAGQIPAHLGIYYLNTTTNEWEYVGGKVDEAKKTVSATLTHFSKYAILLANKTFPDLAGHWAKESVELLAAKDGVRGNTRGDFQPDSAITRAEFAQILANALGVADEASEATFSDVNASDWYYGAIEALAKRGVVTGYSGQFRPNDRISRQDMMVMLARALGDSVTADTSALAGFSDASTIASYAQEAAAVSVSKGLVQGDSSGALSPLAQATRAEAATMILRLMQELGII